MSKRSQQQELIDLGSAFYSKSEYVDCLHKLGCINHWLGGNRATFWAFNQLERTPESILDVGCGGGQLAIHLAKKFPYAKIQGIDLSSEAISFANEQLNKEPSIKTVRYSIPLSASLQEPPKSYDVLTATLLCHHLTDEDLIDFLKKSVEIAKEAVIINDLHRNIFASLSYGVIAPIFFSNRLIIHDGLISIKRAFKRKDWLEYLNLAQIPFEACSLSWHPFFRWILIIFPSKVTK